MWIKKKLFFFFFFFGGGGVPFILLLLTVHLMTKRRGGLFSPSRRYLSGQTSLQIDYKNESKGLIWFKLSR